MKVTRKPKIHLYGNYYLSCDPMNWILAESYHSKKHGDTRFRDVAYYGRVDQLCMGVAERIGKDVEADSMKSLSTALHGVADAIQSKVEETQK